MLSDTRAKLLKSVINSIYIFFLIFSLQEKNIYISLKKYCTKKTDIAEVAQNKYYEIRKNSKNVPL